MDSVEVECGRCGVEVTVHFSDRLLGYSLCNSGGLFVLPPFWKVVQRSEVLAVLCCGACVDDVYAAIGKCIDDAGVKR